MNFWKKWYFNKPDEPLPRFTGSLCNALWTGLDTSLVEVEASWNSSVLSYMACQFLFSFFFHYFIAFCFLHFFVHVCLFVCFCPKKERTQLPCTLLLLLPMILLTFNIQNIYIVLLNYFEFENCVNPCSNQPKGGKESRRKKKKKKKKKDSFIV